MKMPRCPLTPWHNPCHKDASVLFIILVQAPVDETEAKSPGTSVHSDGQGAGLEDHPGSVDVDATGESNFQLWECVHPPGMQRRKEEQIRLNTKTIK